VHVHQEVADDQAIDRQQYKFLDIAALPAQEAGAFVDILGVVERSSAVSDIVSRQKQRKLKKRSLCVVDRTACVEVVLWNELAEQFADEHLGPGVVVALKAARVSDFGGRCGFLLSTLGRRVPRSLTATNVEPWPQHERAAPLLQWWQAQAEEDLPLPITSTAYGLVAEVCAPAPRRSFDEVEDEQMFTVVATITAIRQSVDRPPWYKACPAPDTNAKVVADGAGRWFCLKNGKTYSSYEPRYLLRLLLSDWSGQQWVHAFDDTACTILHGVPARQASATPALPPPQHCCARRWRPCWRPVARTTSPACLTPPCSAGCSSSCA